MIRLTHTLAACALLTLMPATPAAADPANPPNLGIVDFCKVDVPANHPDQPLGACISFQSTNFRDNLNGLVPHLCSYMEDVHPELFDAFYDSYDECVRDKASAFLS